jgi:3D (Asp-Asp-Asp) domain-containing protein
MNYRHTAVALAVLLCSGACSLDHSPSQPIGDLGKQPVLVAAAPAPAPGTGDVVPEPGRRMGEYQLTYYWMAREANGFGPNDHVLYSAKGCAPIATVNAHFAERLQVEGTGQLRDGRVLNTSGSCTCPGAMCYFVVAKHKKWGVGVGKKALLPFRTVAVDPRLVKIGTMLYIPELDGLTMPGREGFVHDGCVLAGDRGGGIEGRQLDFFVAQRTNYNLLYGRHALKQVTVFEGSLRCQRKGQTVAAARPAI